MTQPDKLTIEQVQDTIVYEARRKRSTSLLCQLHDALLAFESQFQVTKKLMDDNKRLREILTQCDDYIRHRHNMGRQIRSGKRLLLMTKCNDILQPNKDSNV